MTHGAYSRPRLFAKYLTELAAFVALCWSQAGLAQEPSSSTMQLVARSVGRVVAKQCGDTPVRVGTGFLWQNNQTLVTARHVIAGCSDIQVAFAATGQAVTAVPKRELRGRDLVLLRVSAPVNVPPLQAAAGLPPVGSKVAVLGFALGAPTLDDKMLDVTVANAPPGSKLADMLPPSLQDMLRASGELELDTDVLRLDGNLLPGHSGAPLIDGSGRVRAIGSGGLQNGAGGVVWALRADYLNELTNAPETAAVQAADHNSGLSFAYQSEQNSLRKVRCGSSNFTFSRTVPLSVLYETSDDKVGLQQLAAVSNMAELAAGAVRYDVWVDADTGASVTVPAGKHLVANTDGTCSAAVSAQVDMIITALPVTGSTAVEKYQQVQAGSSGFEMSLSSKFQTPLMTDPSYTYLAPVTRADGFTVRRAAYVRNSPGSTMNELRSDYAFVTHMTRGSRYYGIASLRRNFVVDLAKYQACAAAPQGRGCKAIKDSFRDWSISAVAVHLATMPPL